MANPRVLLILWDYPFDCRKAPVSRAYHLFKEIRRKIPETYLIFAGGDTNQAEDENIVMLGCKREASQNTIKQALYSLRACLQTLRFIYSQKIDTVIMRGVGTAFLIPFLQILGIRVFYDFHGFLYKELEMKKRSRMVIMGVGQLERYLIRSSDGIVGVTNEITQYKVSRSSDPKKPCITIGNGFDVASVSVRKPLPFAGNELRLLCVANVSRWHGLDRVLHGLAVYSGTFEVTLHVAGDGQELPSIRQLAEDLGIVDKVIFHGFMSGRELDSLFDQCHIAVGSLGVHRIGLREASTLKAREYCARGIPFIYGIPDPDFSNNFPDLLYLPADETSVDVKEVIKFASETYADPYHPQKMRCYAMEHLDWSVKAKGLEDILKVREDKCGDFA